MINLGLAVFWGVLGVGLLIYHFTTNDPSFRLAIGGGRLSTGWLALVISFYNVARWWSQRSAAANRRAQSEANARREQRRPPSRPYGDPDPNFIFTDPPPAPPPSDAPPPAK